MLFIRATWRPSSPSPSLPDSDTTTIVVLSDDGDLRTTVSTVAVWGGITPLERATARGMKVTRLVALGVARVRRGRDDSTRGRGCLNET